MKVPATLLTDLTGGELKPRETASVTRYRAFSVGSQEPSRLSFDANSEEALWQQAFGIIRQAIDDAFPVRSSKGGRYSLTPDSADTLFASALQYGFQHIQQQETPGYGDMSAVMALGLALDTGYRKAISAVAAMSVHPGMAEQLAVSHQKLQSEWNASLGLVIAGTAAAGFGL